MSGPRCTSPSARSKPRAKDERGQRVEARCVRLGIRPEDLAETDSKSVVPRLVPYGFAHPGPILLGITTTSGGFEITRIKGPARIYPCRSEERRVGKETSARSWADRYKE